MIHMELESSLSSATQAAEPGWEASLLPPELKFSSFLLQYFLAAHSGQDLYLKLFRTKLDCYLPAG